MNEIQTEVAIIGAGTAGLTAYRAARAAGKRALLIEGGPYGTTCARVGCMPSKLLIAAAEAAHVATTAEAFGVQAGPVRIDGEAVMARVRRERDRFVGFVLEGVDEIPAEDKLRGYARFTAPNRLMVGDHTAVQAERFVIATGSSPIVPEQWRAAGPNVISSDAVFDWTTLPESVAVIGTGIIGLELGQALHRLGVRVAFFARGSSIAQLGDPEVLKTAAGVLAEELDLRFQTQVVSVNAEGGQLALVSRDAEGRERSERFQYVLAAVGREPNVHALGLENAAIERDRRGIPLYDRHTMQCGSSPVFIAGDANDELPLLGEAADQGRIAGHNAALWPEVEPGLRRTALTIAFTEPNIATMGADFRDLAASHHGRFAVGHVSFANQGRSRVMLQNRGMLRVYGEYGSGRFLGAEMIGPRAEHIGHLLSWAVQAGLTVKQMLDMPFYHPVVEEGVRTALRELAQQLAKPPGSEPECPDCTPAP